MKRTIFVVLTVMAIIAMMTGVAFADRYDAVYLDPTAGSSPHGGYDTTTNKCAVCHAVHNPGGISALSADDKHVEATRDTALGASEVLLRDDVANACTYCHVSDNFAIKTVYAETPDNYETAGDTAHNTNGGAMSNTGVNCTNCHQVHGAATMMVSAANGGVVDDYMQAKILKWNSAAGASDNDAPAMVANGDVSANQANMSTWCSQCHRYYNAGYDGDSHTMRADSGNYANGSASTPPNGTRVAWAPSTYCRSCHQDGVTDQLPATDGANNYPHFTGGYRFLLQATDDAAAAAVSGGQNDGNCLICHAGDDGSSNIIGAGLTY